MPWLLSPTISMLETSNHEITPGKLAAVVNVVRSIHNVCSETFHIVVISVYNSKTYLVQTVYCSMQPVYCSMQTVYCSMQTVYCSMQTVSSTHSKLALGIFLSSVERTVVPELLNFIGSIVPEISVKQGTQSVSPVGSFLSPLFLPSSSPTPLLL